MSWALGTNRITWDPVPPYPTLAPLRTWASLSIAPTTQGAERTLEAKEAFGALLT